MIRTFLSHPRAMRVGLALLCVAVVGSLALPLVKVHAADTPAAAGSAGSHAAMSITQSLALQRDWPVTLSASGAVAPWMEASIGARVTGLPLDQVLVNVGDRVRKGQLLAHFDDATVKAELAQQNAALTQAQASATQAEANAQQASANHARALSIQSSGAISEQDVLQYATQAATAQAQLAQAHAQIAQARAQLDASQLKLEFTRVTAPDDGIISARGATIGSVSQAAGSGAELFRLIRQGRLEWRAELTATQLTQIKPGLLVQITLPDGTQAGGRVRQLAPALDSTTRLGLAYVDLPTGTRALPAMYLNGNFQFPARKALTVPAESVVIRDGRSYVLRLEDKHSHLVAVTTGRRQGNEVEILAGLKPGDPVAVKGAGFLNDNDAVQILGSAAGAQP